MVTRLHAAQTKDRQKSKSAECKKKIIQAAVSGDSSVTIHFLYQEEMLRWIRVIRERFAGIAIHRTLQSVDNTGARISGLGPLYRHHLLVKLLVKLYLHGIENLEALAKELVADGTQRAAKTATVSVSHVFLMVNTSGTN